jgi:adenylyltransferase/sulfurtransferase
MSFTEEQIQRYSRHIILPEVGGKGQTKIRQAKVFVVGAGGLGSPVAYYLAAAGVGTIGIADGDVVDLSNLHRQIIHATPDLNKPKVVSAKEKIESLNPDVAVAAYPERITAKNALDLLKEYDLIVDGADNFGTKFLVNDAAVFLKKPLVHAGILRFDGQVMTILPGRSACYRCLFRQPPPAGLIPSCQEAGVLGVLAGVIGTIQATEALKLILGIGQPLTDRMLIYDARTARFREARLKRNPRCPVCSDTPEIKELVDYEQPVCEMPSVPVKG